MRTAVKPQVLQIDGALNGIFLEPRNLVLLRPFGSSQVLSFVSDSKFEGLLVDLAVLRHEG